ncbi:hypothetical protein [Pedobacter sp. PACM 27299]|uniref:hypothetical protein n=1 Tax=Pedobacter sp. PACM 27299 TaxID=1727164 RepID=UPI000AC076AE|nr:hypothetical protein [Pedobacter sp. PACM 27299]
MSWVEVTKPSIGQMAPVIAGGVLLLVAFAYIIFKWVDISIRSFLKLKMDK